jgi:hypothetical protein
MGRRKACVRKELGEIGGLWIFSDGKWFENPKGRG